MDLVGPRPGREVPVVAGVPAGPGHTVGTGTASQDGPPGPEHVAIAPPGPLLTVDPMSNDDTTLHCPSTCPLAAVDDRTWGPREVARFLGCSTESVREKLGQDPDFPPPLVIGVRTVRWLPSAVRAYVQQAHDRRLPVREPAPARRVVDRV